MATSTRQKQIEYDLMHVYKFVTSKMQQVADKHSVHIDYRFEIKQVRTPLVFDNDTGQVINVSERKQSKKKTSKKKAVKKKTTKRKKY